MLAGDVVAVEVNEARARELEENVRRLGATNVPGRLRRRSRASARADRLRPRARRCAVLGPRRARRPARPALALAAAAGAPARAAAAPPLPASAPAEPSRTPSAPSTATRPRRSSTPRGSPSTRLARRRVAAVPPPDAAGVPADPAARPRHERVLHRAPARSVSAGSRDAVTRFGRTVCGGRRIAPWGGRTGSGAEARSSRRSTPPTSPASASRSTRSLDAGCRIFHFDVGDAPLHPPGHDRAGRAALDRADDPRRRRRARLPPDGRRPGASLRRVRRVGRRLRHLPRRGDRTTRAASAAAARALGLAVGVAFNPGTEPPEAAALRRRRPAPRWSSA